MSTEETRSYRDPVGERTQAAVSARKKREERFPNALTVYDSFYITFTSTDKRSAAFLAGSEGIIGTELTLLFSNKDAEEEAVFLLARDEAVIARVSEADAARLRFHYEKDWAIKAVLSLIFYHEAKKCFSAELACFCYDRMLDDSYGHALENFVNNLIYRINKGAHPTLELGQEQFIKVLESKGAWYLTKNMPYPPKEKGVIIYKRRRIWSEYLVVAAMNGNLGCRIAAIAFWVLVAAAVVFALWWFLIR